MNCFCSKQHFNSNLRKEIVAKEKQDFIHVLTTHEDLNPKEYASDLKHFAGWFEKQQTIKRNGVIFRIEMAITNNPEFRKPII